VLAYLREKELLLVLDNFEQLLTPDQGEDERGVALLMDILHQAPGVTLLVTSRERLALPGEWLFDVAGLSCPPGELAEGVEGYSAVQLFVQRAGQVRRQFTLDGEARTVARICQLVEGLPLAIELAAAGLRTRSCTAIANAIETSIMALASGMRAIPERHRSMWAAFEHSWRLLSNEERQVLRRLSVFRGGFEEQATAQVAKASPELLAVLLDKSLLRWDGVARYDMHELVRQYAGEKLYESGEENDIRHRHAKYFLALVETAEPKLTSGERRQCLESLDREHDNVRAALAWSQSVEGEVGVGLQLATAMGQFWEFRGHLREGCAWLSDALTYALEPTRLRARALNALGTLTFPSDFKSARASFTESFAIGQALGDKQSVADALFGLGGIEQYTDDTNAANNRLRASLALYRELGNKARSAKALYLLGYLAASEDDYQRAAELWEEGLALSRELGDMRGSAMLLEMMGRSARWQNDAARAAAYLQESLDLYRALDDQLEATSPLLGLADVAQLQGDYGWAAILLNEALAQYRKFGHALGLAWTLINLGDVVLYQGDALRARALYVDSLALFREFEHKDGIWQCLLGFAGVASAVGQAARAARLDGAAAALSESWNTSIEDLPPDDRMHYDRTIAAVHAQLDEAAFAAAWAEGQAMSLGQAIAYALEGSEVDTSSSTAT
jgi:predicted ATPase